MNLGYTVRIYDARFRCWFYNCAATRTKLARAMFNRKRPHQPRYASEVGWLSRDSVIFCPTPAICTIEHKMGPIFTWHQENRKHDTTLCWSSGQPQAAKLTLIHPLPKRLREEPAHNPESSKKDGITEAVQELGLDTHSRSQPTILSNMVIMGSLRKLPQRLNLSLQPLIYEPPNIRPNASTWVA